MAIMSGRARRTARGLLALVVAATIAWPGGLAWGQAGRDVYIKGLEHLDAKRWAEAAQAFEAAIAADPRESKGARLYGMRYGYFPHRDKGVALYHLGKFDEAIPALEESIRQGATAEATKTLDLARKKQPAVATAGVFRDTFWDFYERGLKYSEAGAWPAAIQDFRAARAKRDKEDRRARTYGVDFIEYFPVRELGVALYQDGQYKAAVSELEKSLAAFPTAKAAYYYNLARAALLRQAAADPSPPRITIDAPADGLLTSALAMEVRGSAQSKNQVALVEVNGEPELIDAAAPTRPFTQVAELAPGDNVIRVRARDLIGQETLATIKVTVDREGPAVIMDSATRVASGIRLEGTVADNVRLGGLQVNGRPVTLGAGAESRFSAEVPATATAFQIEAADAVGNVTRVRIPIPAGLRQSRLLHGTDVVPVAWRKQLVPSFLQRAGLTLEMEKPPAEVQQDSVSIAGVVGSGAGLKELKINGQAHQIPAAAASKPFAFSYGVPLTEGANTITVVATDQGGKTETRTFTVVRKVEEIAQVGSRLAVAVLPVNHKGQPSPAYATALEAITDALVNQRRFKVLSRDQLEAILREQKLSATQLVDSATAVKVGKLVAAEAVIAVTVNETPKSVEAYAQLISTETSTVLASKDIFDPEKAPGSARAKMLELAAKLKQDYPLVEGAVMMVANKRIVVGIGTPKNVRPDMKVIVYQEGQPLIDPTTKEVLDRPIESLGEGVLKEIKEKISYAEMRDSARVEQTIAQKKVVKVITK
jgi:tetratricopeptide (TPR) repeat protein